MSDYEDEEKANLLSVQGHEEDGKTDVSEKESRKNVSVARPLVYSLIAALGALAFGCELNPAFHCIACFGCKSHFKLRI